MRENERNRHVTEWKAHYFIILSFSLVPFFHEQLIDSFSSMLKVNSCIFELILLMSPRCITSLFDS